MPRGYISNAGPYQGLFTGMQKQIFYRVYTIIQFQFTVTPFVNNPKVA